MWCDCYSENSPLKAGFNSFEIDSSCHFDVVLCSNSFSDSLFHLSQKIVYPLLCNYPHDVHLVPLNVDVDDLWSCKMTFPC